MIPYGKQHISQHDIDAVVDVLKSDRLTQGPKVPEFEQAIAQYCHAKFGIAVNSATSALHIACLALDVSQGDIVWTSPVTFVASANCALYCGASIDFVDIDTDTGNISILALAEKLQQAQINDALPKVLIPVHLAGQSCDMQAISELAQQYNVKVIEDASHAIGASYQDNPVGNCQFSEITVFSFHPVKIITSAEGGMATTNCPTLAQKMQQLRSHGITAEQEHMTEISHGPWYYQQIALGFNYRMTELQAALGLSQLSALDSFVEKRNQLAAFYDKAFAKSELSPLTQMPHSYSAYHLYIIKLPNPDKQKHKALVEQLRAKDIFAQIHYIPVHMQPYYQQLGFNQGDFPKAERYYQQALSLPLYPYLTREEQEYVISTVQSLL